MAEPCWYSSAANAGIALVRPTHQVIDSILCILVSTLPIMAPSSQCDNTALPLTAYSRLPSLCYDRVGLLHLCRPIAMIT